MNSLALNKDALDYLIQQFNSYRFKKKDINSLQQANTGTLNSGKKHEQAFTLAQILVSQFDNKRRQLQQKLGPQETDKIFSQFVASKFQSIKLNPLFLNSFIYKICDIYKQEREVMNQRQLRNFQSLAQNIWSRSQQTFTSCLCESSQQKKKSPESQQCYKCHHKFHPQCFWPKQKDKFYECPFCYLQMSMPQKQVEDVLFAGYIPRAKRQRIQYKISFHLNEKYKIDKNLYIQTRCVKFNSKNRFEMSWPDSGSFSVNKTKLNDFKPLPTNSPLKRRPDQPIKLDKIRLFSENQVIIQQRPFNDYSYKPIQSEFHLVMIVIFKEIPKQFLVVKLQKNLLQTEISKKTLKDYFNKHSEDEVDIQQLSISLRCQFFASRIRKPTRSVQCSRHYQVFDLQNFVYSSISAKSSTKKWKCPICDQRSYDLIVDEYVMDIMQKQVHSMQVKFGRDCEPVFIQNQQQIDEEDQSDNVRRIDYRSREQILNSRDIPDLLNNFINLDSEEIGQDQEINQNQLEQLDITPVGVEQNSKSSVRKNKQSEIEPPKRSRPKFGNNKDLTSTIRKMKDIRPSSIMNMNNDDNIQQISEVVQILSEDSAEMRIISESTEKKNNLNTQNVTNKSSIPKEKNSQLIISKPKYRKNNSNHEESRQNSNGHEQPLIQLSTMTKKTSKTDKLNFINNKDINIIQIDSDNQNSNNKQIQIHNVSDKSGSYQKSGSSQDTQQNQNKLKQLYEKLELAHRLVNVQSEGNTNITQEDTQVFQSIYDKIISMSTKGF